MKKWKIISELIEKLDNRTFEPNEFEGNLKCICYAPNIGYRSWIFKYNKVFVALFDAGYDHYNFNTAVSIFDVIVALLMDRFPRLFKAYWED